MELNNQKQGGRASTYNRRGSFCGDRNEIPTPIFRPQLFSNTRLEMFGYLFRKSSPCFYTVPAPARRNANGMAVEIYIIQRIAILHSAFEIMIYTGCPRD